MNMEQAGAEIRALEAALKEMAERFVEASAEINRLRDVIDQLNWTNSELREELQDLRSRYNHVVNRFGDEM